MIFVVSPRKLAEAGKLLDKMNEDWYPIGAVIPRTRSERQWCRRVACSASTTR